MPGLLDVAVEHGSIRSQTQFMSRAMHVEPDFGVGLVFAEFVAHLGIEDLRSATGHAAQARVDHFFERPADRFLRDVCEPVDFDRRPGLDVNVRIGFSDHANDVQVPVELFQMMQSADDVDFGCATRDSFEHTFANHRIGEFVALLVTQVGPKRTKPAAVHADVRGIQMDVGVVVREIAVLSFANDIRKSAERQQIDLFVEIHSIVKSQPLTGVDFVCDGIQVGGSHDLWELSRLVSEDCRLQPMC